MPCRITTDGNFHIHLTAQESNLFIFKAATLAFGALLRPCDWVIRQHSAGRLCQMSFYFSLYEPEHREERKGAERGEKLSDDVSTKSYYTQKVILVYLSSLLSLLVQAYRNSPIWAFFSIFFFFSPRLSPLCCVQRSVHLFSTTGKVFVFICFYKLQGAEAFRGATVFLSPPPQHLPQVRMTRACPSMYICRGSWMVMATGISTIIHVSSVPNEGGLRPGASLSFPGFFYDHQPIRLDVHNNGNPLKTHCRLEYCWIR